MELFKLIADIVTGLWDYIVPFYVIEPFEQGIEIRLGVYRRTVTQGLRWKFPFLDVIYTQRITTTTLSTNPQSLTTHDGQDIVVSAVIKYRVTDVKVFLLDVENAKDALADITQGTIKGIVMARTWEGCRHTDIDKDITTKVRREAKRWGIEVDSVTLVDIALLMSVRLLTDANKAVV